MVATKSWSAVGELAAAFPGARYLLAACRHRSDAVDVGVALATWSRGTEGAVRFSRGNHDA